jgi:RNA polymerase sigma-70 factor (ECF subfamily)
VAAVEALLADDVRALSDGGGEYVAARVPLCGRRRVARTYVKLGAQGDSEAVRFAVRVVNGLPALVLEHDRPRPRWAPRWVVQVELGDDGRIRSVYSVLAAAKIGPLRL